jgi:hypothetical protein
MSTNLCAWLAAGAAAFAAVAGQAQNAPAGTLADALRGGEAHIEFRARIETVEDDALARDATAMTLRTRLRLDSAAWKGLRARVEFDDIRALDDDQYNSTVNGVLNRPVIADPEGTEVNQAYLEWQNKSWRVTGGRQRINLDNARFIGNVGWRQNEQTYDGLTLKFSARKEFALSYSWVENVNRVFGPRSGAQAANWHGTSHLLNAGLDLQAAGQLVLYGYWLEFDNAPASSSMTSGAKWNFSRSLGKKFRLESTLAYASQSDAGRNPLDYSTDYWQAELGGTWQQNYTLLAGFERLDGERSVPGRAFQTPLATLHAFQGWADKFLTTPPQGIDDLYVLARAKIAGFSLTAVYHDFDAAAIDRNYGSEWDLSATRTFSKRYEVMLKAADYRASSFATDTTKWWLMASANF